MNQETNKELIDYIKFQLSQGVSKEKIIEVLTKEAGWPMGDVNETFSFMEGQGLSNNDISLSVPAEAIVKKSKNKVIAWIIISFFACAVLVGGYYFYSLNRIITTPVLDQGSTGKDIESFDDSDLKIAINDRTVGCWPIDASGLSTSTSYAISTSSVEVSEGNKEVVIRNNEQIDNFLKGGSWTETFGAADSDYTVCPLGNYRKMSYLAIEKAKMLLATGKNDEAKAVFSSLLDVNQNIQNNAEQLITYLVTIAVKNIVIDTIEMLASKNVINKADYLPVVSRYEDNMIGFNRALQGEYAHIVNINLYLYRYSSGSSLDEKSFFDKLDISLEDKKKLEKAYNDPFMFQINKTKEMVFNYFKGLYLNAKNGCVIDYSYEIPGGFDVLKINTENYLGKFYVSNFLGVSTVSKKVCSINKKYEDFVGSVKE